MNLTAQADTLDENLALLRELATTIELHRLYIDIKEGIENLRERA